MNNLISKSIMLTDEEYKNVTSIGINNLLYLLFALICSLAVVAIAYYVSKTYIDLISAIVAFFTGIISIILFVILIIALGFMIIYRITNQPGKTMVQESVPITEIKKYIKIDNNRLTIDSLPENYQYKDNKLDRTKAHDFKIDDFYKESNVKLIDSNSNTYEITHEQLEELKRGKNNENN